MINNDNGKIMVPPSFTALVPLILQLVPLNYRSKIVILIKGTTLVPHFCIAIIALRLVPSVCSNNDLTSGTRTYFTNGTKHNFAIGTY